MNIENGKTYQNGRGEPIGPMDERQPGVFLDQYGRLYRPNGHQWDHAPESLGNIIGEQCEHPWAAHDGQGAYCQACGVRWYYINLQKLEPV